MDLIKQEREGYIVYIVFQWYRINVVTKTIKCPDVNFLHNTLATGTGKVSTLNTIFSNSFWQTQNWEAGSNVESVRITNIFSWTEKIKQLFLEWWNHESEVSIADRKTYLNIYNFVLTIIFNTYT